MRLFFCFLLIINCQFNTTAQELFPIAEPASNIPKGVIGARLFGEAHREINIWRKMGALRLMYGLTSKLTLMINSSMSNHHGDSLPYNLTTHRHIGNQTIYYTQNVQRGMLYPYRFNGFYCYAKYRFFTADGQNKHYRMALYGEWSNVKSAHDEAEPNLLDDTKGYGGGLIITYLSNRFSTSLTTGIILPQTYIEIKDLSYWTGINGLTKTKINYGRAVQYNLSFGYLLYPHKYENYNQNNWNVYLEFIGKSYEAAQIWQNGNLIEIESPALKANNYVEIHPGIQKIIDSNFRMDFSIGFNMIKKSYVNFYPMYRIGIQRYFYPHKKNYKK